MDSTDSFQHLNHESMHTSKYNQILYTCGASGPFDGYSDVRSTYA